MYRVRAQLPPLMSLRRRRRARAARRARELAERERVCARAARRSLQPQPCRVSHPRPTARLARDDARARRGSSRTRRNITRAHPSLKMQPYRKGDFVEVFYRMGSDDGGYFPVVTPSAGQLRPRFGRSDGWIGARIEDDWPPPPPKKASPEQFVKSGSARWAHGCSVGRPACQIVRNAKGADRPFACKCTGFRNRLCVDV